MPELWASAASIFAALARQYSSFAFDYGQQGHGQQGDEFVQVSECCRAQMDLDRRTIDEYKCGDSMSLVVNRQNEVALL
jgi:hypothetical protein